MTRSSFLTHNNMTQHNIWTFRTNDHVTSNRYKHASD